MSEQEDVEDFRAGINTAWAVTFAALYIKSMLIALAVYLLLFRSIALSPRKNNPTLLSILFLFFCYLVDMGLEMEELINLFSHSLHTTANCRLVTYTTYGNKILQAMIVMFMLYYNMLSGYFKTYRFEVVTVQLFPFIVLGLLLLELLLTIHPTMRVTGHESGRYCVVVGTDGLAVDSWFYNVLLPYWFPLIFSVPPAVYMILRHREREYNEPRKTQVRVSLCIAGSFFLANLLYYLLMLAREIEAATVTRTEWQHLLGTSVMYITRPMFAYIAHIWHIAVPLLALTQDAELKRHLPKMPKLKDLFSMKKTSKLEETDGGGGGGGDGPEAVDMQRSNGIVNKNVDVEDREYHSSPVTDVVVIG